MEREDDLVFLFFGDALGLLKSFLSFLSEFIQSKHGIPQEKTGPGFPRPSIYYDAPRTTWFPATAEIANVCRFERGSAEISPIRRLPNPLPARQRANHGRG